VRRVFFRGGGRHRGGGGGGGGGGGDGGGGTAVSELDLFQLVTKTERGPFYFAIRPMCLTVVVRYRGRVWSGPQWRCTVVSHAASHAASRAIPGSPPSPSSSSTDVPRFHRKERRMPRRNDPGMTIDRVTLTTRGRRTVWRTRPSFKKSVSFRSLPVTRLPSIQPSIQLSI